MSNIDPPNILIAEDNDVSRDLMVGILRNAGYNIIPARNGNDAIARVQEDTPIALALVDINMAPKGGFEFIKFMVASEIKIPSVIITGDNSSDILTEASALGVVQVFQKPVEPDRLIKTVERVLARYSKTDNYKL